MDALLRYILYNIAFTLLTLEIVLMVICCLAIIVTKIITKRNLIKRNYIQDEIGKIIESHLFHEQPIEKIYIPQKFSQFRNLVEVLEKYDQRFNDNRWLVIKEKIFMTYLLPHLENMTSSLFWVNRHLAARALLLCPQKADVKWLHKLLNDSRYLVRVTAAVCITKTSHRELFYEVLKKMSEETSLSQFPYRDALIQVDQEKYDWMAALLSKESDKKIIAICLDVLSSRYSRHLLPLIKPFVNDPDSACRRLAIKALGNIPNEESIRLLTEHLVDSEWEIRAESVIGLQKLYAVQAIPKIQVLLNDPVWWVRLQAALALKAFGIEGRDVLSTRDRENEPRAYEIAQYALALP